MNKDVYESTTNHMFVQIKVLEELVQRKLTEDELNNLHEFFSNLPVILQEQFIDQFGALV